VALTPAELTALERELDLLSKVETKKTALNKLDGEAIQQLKDLGRLTGENKSALQALIAERERDIAVAERHVDILKGQQTTEAGAHAKRIDQAVEVIEAQKDILRAKIALAKDPAAVEAINAEMRDHDKRQQKLIDSKSAAEELGQAFLSTFSMDYSVDFVGTMKKIGDALHNTNSKALLLQNAMLGMATSAINNVAGLIKALYNAENEFRKATGASVEFASSIRDVYKDTRLTGATIEDASAAMVSLHGTYTDFTMQSKAMREELSETSVVLGRLGVSHEDFAKGVQMSTKAFGVSASMADDTMRELTAHARDLGIAPQKMMQDFAGAGSTLAKFGDQGVKAFKDMQYASKITGMEMDKILSIANKFDTFEDAAGMAGKLNAALGGNFVNAMDMMMETDPAERFNMIRDSILDAGLTFDDMSYYQKQFYTESLGLSDVGDLAMMLSGNMDGLAGDIGKTSKELVAMKEQAAAVQKLSDQWNAVLAESVVIMAPLIDGLRFFIGLMIEYPEAVQAAIYTTIVWTTYTKWATIAETARGIATAFTTKKFWLFALAASALAYILFKARSSPTFFEGIGLMAIGFIGLGVAVRLAGNAMRGSTGPILAVGGAMLMVGGGVALASLGLSELAASFAGLGDAAVPAAVAIGIFTLAFVGLMIALAAMVTGPQAVVAAGAVGLLLSIGAAALMIGGGMGLAALGVSKLIESFAVLFEVLPIGQFVIFVATMAAFGYVLVALGVAAPLAAVGLGVIGAAMLYLGLGLLMIQPTLTVLTEFMGSISTLVDKATELSTVAEQFERIASAVNSIPENKAVSMSVVMATAARAAMAGPPAAAAAAAGAAPSTVASAGGAKAVERPYEVTINFDIDGNKICDKVVKCMGGECTDALYGYSRQY